MFHTDDELSFPRFFFKSVILNIGVIETIITLRLMSCGKTGSCINDSALLLLWYSTVFSVMLFKTINKKILN